MDWEIYERWEPPDGAEEGSEADAERGVAPPAYDLAVVETEVSSESEELEIWFTEWSIGQPVRASERDRATPTG